MPHSCRSLSTDLFNGRFRVLRRPRATGQLLPLTVDQSSDHDTLIAVITDPELIRAQTARVCCVGSWGERQQSEAFRTVERV